LQLKKLNITLETILYCEDQYETLIDADCLAILTEWPEFKFQI
jgi:UDPglucose 6-dehydrogenase